MNYGVDLDQLFLKILRLFKRFLPVMSIGLVPKSPGLADVAQISQMGTRIHLVVTPAATGTKLTLSRAILF